MSYASLHRPEPQTGPLSAIIEQVTTCHREVRELRDPPSSVLGKATHQRNQACDNGESHEAEKRATEPNENTARRHVRMDDGRPDHLPPPERREAHHRNRT